jgi:hypothetical protein
VSSTNRGGQRSPADAYATPLWCVRRLLEVFDPKRELQGPWLEPGAGEGNIIHGVREFYPGVQFTALEIREECTPILAKLPKTRVKCPKDYFEWARFNRQEYDVVITNPPFRLALEFIETSLLASKVTIMLLRLNFIGSKKRHVFFRECMPNFIYVLPDRPSFDHRGTDSIEYMWAVWDKRLPPTNYSKLVLLDLTPAEEKK